MKNTILNIKKNPIEAIQVVFSPLIYTWAILEVSIYFLGDMIPGDYKKYTYILLFIFGFLKLLKNYSLSKIKISIGNVEVIIKYGNIFNEDKHIKIIPSDVTMRNDAIDGSLKSQFFDMCYKKRIHLTFSNYAEDERKKSPDSNLKKGQLIPQMVHEEEYYLFALTDIENDNTKAISYDDLWDSLNYLWQQLSDENKSISIPLLGHNVKGIDLNPFQLLQVILISIFFSIKTHGFKTKNGNCINIILYDDVNSSHKKYINLYKLKNIWEKFY